MNINKKIKKGKVIVTAAVLCLVFITAGVLAFDNLAASENEREISHSFDSFGKYAGTNDTKDGIALSACESSILSPTENQILWHNDPIRFTAEHEHDGRPEDLDFLKWQRRTYGAGGFYDSEWSTFCPEISTRLGYAYCPADPYMDFQDSTHFRVARKYDVMFVPSTGVATTYPNVNFFTGYKLNVAIGTGTGAASEYVLSTTFPSKSASNPLSHTINTVKLNCNNSKENTSDCVRIVKSGIAVTLTAYPGTKFLRWSSGAPCNGSTNRACSFVMNNDYTVYANFQSCVATCGNWGSCSANCGPGTRSRTCARTDCSTYTESESCNNGDCSGPDDSAEYKWKEVAP